jgi:hypothetical protein
MSRFAECSRRSVLMTAFSLALLLSGCSSIYYDRRDTVSFGAGDAVATNEVSQTVDIWPEAAGYRNITFNGQKMQSAVERYRTNKVTPPQGMNTSSVGYQQSSPAPTATTPSVTQ